MAMSRNKSQIRVEAFWSIQRQTVKLFTCTGNFQRHIRCKRWGKHILHRRHLHRGKHHRLRSCRGQSRRTGWRCTGQKPQRWGQGKRGAANAKKELPNNPKTQLTNTYKLVHVERYLTDCCRLMPESESPSVLYSNGRTNRHRMLERRRKKNQSRFGKLAAFRQSSVYKATSCS